MTKRTAKLPQKPPKEYLAEVIRSVSISISDNNIQKLLDAFESVVYDKHTKIIKEGDITSYLYFISKGLVRVYYFNNGKELIDWFAEEGSFFGNLYSHILQKPGFDIYEAMEDVTVLRIKYTDLERLFKESHEIESIARKVLEKYYVTYVEKRVHHLKGLSSDEKYTAFLKNYASCSNRIPLKYVANYLGISSETLSRIRAK